MSAWLPLVATLPFVIALMSSGRWASRRYARFEQLPSHFGITGKADAYAPRRTMTWMLPILFSVVLVSITVFITVLPPEFQNGDPLVGTIVGGASLLGAQIFVLWLTERWAREPKPD